MFVRGQKKMEDAKYINKFIKIYPFLKGFTDDLLFYIAIDTLFLTIVKGLSADQIVLQTVISSFIALISRLILIKFIRKIGNTYSVRLGMVLLLLSAIFITFSPKYLGIVIGKVIYELSWTFKDMENVMLKNNLSVLGREREYANIANKGMIVYAFLTFVIAIISGYIFNINNYMPMYLCILICSIATIIYFFMKDVSNNNIIKENTNTNIKKENIKNKFPKVLIAIFIIYAIFFGIINTGQPNSKLLIQYQLSDIFDTEKVSIYLGIIVAFSRISRLVSTIVFGKIYEKLQNKSLIILTCMLMSSFLFIIIGYICPITFVKFILMTIGFCLILSVRDPFRLYIQDVSFKLVSTNQYQTAISYIQFSRKVGTTICSLIVYAILLKWELINVIYGLLGLSIMQAIISIKLYNMIKYEMVKNNNAN